MTTPTPPACDENDPNAITFEAALDRILAAVSHLGETEIVPLRQALGRILAADVVSRIDVPAFDNSAMDGYALRGTDLPREGTARLRLIGTAFAGRPLTQSIGPGECARIMTGAKLPHGADTVIMQEHVEAGPDCIVISHGHMKGQYVRHTGDDIPRGATMMPAGRRLTPADLGLLASVGIIEVRVVRRIRAAFMSTGDELCPAGQALGDGQIYDSNRHTLHAMLQRLDADIIDLGIIADDRAAVEQAFATAAAQADVLITTGGVSIGEADFVKETLERLGQVGFWRIAIKPGRPLAFGHIGNCVLFGLPGNPVSAMATFYTLVQPALLRMAGVVEVRPRYLRARLLTELRKKPGRLEFQRGILSIDAQGELQVSSTGGQDSHLLSSMGKADCFIIVPLESSRLDAGELVQVQLFAGLI